MPYEQFIVPGLVLMGVATSAFGNNATSIYQARNDGFIEDPASSPMGPSQLLVGYLAGGVVRSLLIGGAHARRGPGLRGLPGRAIPLVLAAALVGTEPGVLGARAPSSGSTPPAGSSRTSSATW